MLGIRTNLTFLFDKAGKETGYIKPYLPITKIQHQRNHHNLHHVGLHSQP